MTRETSLPAWFSAAMQSAKANATPSSTACVITARGLMTKPDKGSADCRVIVWCALARQIGQKGERTGCFQIGPERTCQIGRRHARHTGIPVERVGCRQDDTHLVPGLRQRMTEGMHRTLRQWPVSIIGDEQHAGRAQ